MMKKIDDVLYKKLEDFKDSGKCLIDFCPESFKIQMEMIEYGCSMSKKLLFIIFEQAIKTYKFFEYVKDETFENFLERNNL